jgi:hypothetical protein
MKSFRSYLPENILTPFFGEQSIVGVEIGVLRAEGSAKLLSKMPKLKLYSIDPWLYQPMRGYEAEDPTLDAEQNQKEQDLSYKLSKERLEEYDNRSVLLRMKSDDAVSVIVESLDFVWIDGDHNGDTVKRDIINWKPKLKDRSILCGHDWRFSHIQGAVKELLGEPKLGDDDIWYFQYDKKL